MATQMLPNLVFGSQDELSESILHLSRDAEKSMAGEQRLVFICCWEHTDFA